MTRLWAEKWCTMLCQKPYRFREFTINAAIKIMKTHETPAKLTHVDARGQARMVDVGEQAAPAP